MAFDLTTSVVNFVNVSDVHSELYCMHFVSVFRVCVLEPLLAHVANSLSRT